MVYTKRESTIFNVKGTIGKILKVEKVKDIIGYAILRKINKRFIILVTDIVTFFYIVNVILGFTI